MKLIPVDPDNEEHVNVLWELFQSRPDHARVSSKGHETTFQRHRLFVRNHPYADWRLIFIDPADVSGSYGPPIGSIYLSQPAQPSIHGDELGVDILIEYQGHGHAERALRLMMAKHGPRRYLAHVANENYASMALFSKLGFRQCQVTFEVTP